MKSLTGLINQKLSTKARTGAPLRPPETAPVPGKFTRPAPVNTHPSSGIPRPHSGFGKNSKCQVPTPEKGNSGSKTNNPRDAPVIRTVETVGSNSFESNMSAPFQEPDPHPPANAENMSNAEIWSSVMAKLNTMQCQQSIALQEIKDEIKATNLGFANDITQIRGELEEIQNKFHSQEARWKDLAHFKQGILEEVRKQVTDHFASEANQLDEKIKNLFSSRLDERILELVAVQISQLEKRIQEGQLELRDVLFEKTEVDVLTIARNIKRDVDKEKGENRKCNLILMGLQESTEEEDEKERVVTLLMNWLSIPKPKIDVVYRLGTQKDGQCPRPLMIIFSKFYSRKSVWFAKSKLNVDQEDKLWIQEDLPPQLRWELSVLLKIQRKAKSMPETYHNVRIKDYRITINEVSYGVEDEDILPQDLCLSAIATPQSEEAVAFFGRDSPFSNHFRCEFESRGLTFSCMEQFLACHKAKMSKNRNLATQILRSADPADHKRALNSMKDAVPEKWSAKVGEILIRGLREKFGQDEYLYKLLLATYPRRLGEASSDPIWGTGFTLRDEKVLDVQAWNEEGNLLGKSLEKVREEFLQKQNSDAL